MSIRRILRHFQNQILRQDIQGTYKQYSLKIPCRNLLIMGTICLIGGLLSLLTFININSQLITYSANTRRQIYLPKGKQFMYIQIDNLYQNNLLYSKSINYDQLKGQTKDLNLKDCAPYDYKDGKPYYPAGSIANTYFQDVIALKGLDIQTDDIAWTKEIQVIGETGYRPRQINIPENWTPQTNKDSVPLNTTVDSGLPILNERFVNWIYLSMFSNFRKLWGIINVETSGYYQLDIESIFDFCGKGLYFSESSWLGLKNYAVSYGLLLIGGLAILTSFLLKRLALAENIYN